ncbi:MAG: MbnP family protein [Crocinitomicaceae bacterium]
MRILLILLLLPVFGFSQKALFLTLKPVFGSQDYQMQTNYVGNNGKVVRLNYLKYYLGDLTIVHDGGQLLDLSENVYLIGDTSFTLFLGQQSVNQIEEVSFLVGVPSRFNTQSGALAQDISLYPETSPLSFQSPSMYWGWAAGYMHMVTEGKADGNNDQTPESLFQLHNFGDHSQAPVNLTNIIQTNTNATQIDIHLNCHIDRWLNNINLASVGILHGEDGLNLEVMQNVLSQNVFDQPANASVDPLSKELVQFSSQQGAIQCAWVGMEKELKLQLLNQSGSLLRTQRVTEGQGQFSWSELSAGIYFIQYLDQQGKSQSRKVVVF